jgi:hypothetical protein
VTDETTDEAIPIKYRVKGGGDHVARVATRTHGSAAKEFGAGDACSRRRRAEKIPRGLVGRVQGPSSYGPPPTPGASCGLGPPATAQGDRPLRPRRLPLLALIADRDYRDGQFQAHSKTGVTPMASRALQRGT